MNIGIFTDTYYPEINGVATSTLELKRELERLGHTVYVFTVTYPNAEEEENVFRMASMPFIFLKERRFGFDFMARWFRKIESLNLDVIHTQTEFNVGQIGRRAAEKLNIPHIHTYHTIYEEYTHYLKVPGNRKLKPAIRRLSRICCDRADEVIVPTTKVQELLLKYGVTKPLIVQPTGIDLRKFGIISQQKLCDLKEQYHISDQNHVLLSVGRLSKEKNGMELLHFIEKIVQLDSNVRVFFVGDGPEREKMEAHIAKQGLEKYFRFTGEVEWKDVQNYYALANVYVSNSTSETQGLTYIEALAAGRPLLVRKDECLSAFLKKGINGYSFENYDEFETNFLRLFIDRNYSKMEAAVRQSADKCGVESFGKRMEGIYAELITRRSKRNKLQKREEIYGKVQSVAG